MIQLTFLGTGAAVPSVDRNVSALMLQREGASFLFDCGEGTQRQMMRYAVCSKAIHRCRRCRA